VSSDEGNSTDAIQLCCEVIVQLSTDHMIHDVMVTVQTNQPLVVHPCVFRWNEMGNDIIDCSVYQLRPSSCFPSPSEVKSDAGTRE